MSQIDDIGAVILALAGSEEAKEAFKRTLGWRDKWEMDHVTIPRASYEALMVAVKDGTALAKAEEAYRSYHDHCGDGAIETGRAWDVMRRRGERMRMSLAALEAAGIDLEQKT